MNSATTARFPDSPFTLHLPFQPGGDQPEAIKQLTEGFENGLSFQTLLGVTGSGKTFTMANVIARLGRPALIFAPNKTLAAQLYSEMREFFPENAVEYFVSYYDYYQPEAYVAGHAIRLLKKTPSINEHIEQMRLSATKALLRTFVIRSSWQLGFGNLWYWETLDAYLQYGIASNAKALENRHQRSIIAALGCNYNIRETDLDFKRGTFRVRGEVIDIFPAESAEMAIRITLFDDEI